MRILAIESSGGVASAAIWENNKILAFERGPFKVTHSETLLPLTAKVFEEAELQPSEVDYIAVSGGPGSFTGLRIGSATAKGLGLAMNKPLIHVPTLEGLAYNIRKEGSLVVPIMDARRSQVYTGVYAFEGGALITKMAGAAMGIDELAAYLKANFEGENIVFLGDGVAVFRDFIEKELPGATFAPEAQMLQSAESVAIRAAELANEGKTVNADDEAPEYLRPSQAERVRMEQGGDKLL